MGTLAGTADDNSLLGPIEVGDGMSVGYLSVEQVGPLEVLAGG